MDIHSVNFEEALYITIKGEIVRLVAFKTQDHGNIKFGVDAPLSINIHREEIYEAIKKKQSEKIIPT
jgi:carbon storage regulator